MPTRPQRSHPTHGLRLIDGQPTINFDTVCTKSRKAWLACDEVHSMLVEVWREATAWLMGRYIIMPDHIHFFAGWTGSEIGYENWVQFWKSQFSKRHQNTQQRWLTDHWDRRVRTAAAYEEKWEYVRRNAVRHGLVKKADDWPYQGEIFELRWD